MPTDDTTPNDKPNANTPPSTRSAATRRRVSQAALAAAIRELRTRNRLTDTKTIPRPRG
jgi:hypothetical protein